MVPYEWHQVTCKSLDKSFTLSSESFFSYEKIPTKWLTKGWNLTIRKNFQKKKQYEKGRKNGRQEIKESQKRWVILGFKPFQVFHKLSMHLFLYSLKPPIKKWNAQSFKRKLQTTAIKPKRSFLKHQHIKLYYLQSNNTVYNQAISTLHT